jgi:hypothetical protein
LRACTAFTRGLKATSLLLGNDEDGKGEDGNGERDSWDMA